MFIIEQSRGYTILGVSIDILTPSLREFFRGKAIKTMSMSIKTMSMSRQHPSTTMEEEAISRRGAESDDDVNFSMSPVAKFHQGMFVYIYHLLV